MMTPLQKRKCRGIFPAGAEILIIGEAPGREEMEVTPPTPFIGASGELLNNLLRKVGIEREACAITNVCQYRPPGNDINEFFYTKTDGRKAGVVELRGRYPYQEVTEGLNELYADIERVRPRLIIAFGNTPLWALTGETGITNWRGSCLYYSLQDGTAIPIIPTLHPASILRKYDWSILALHDLSKAKEILRTGAHPPAPDYKFELYPTPQNCIARLNWLIVQANNAKLRGLPKPRIACDIETRPPFLGCIGLAWSATEAMTFPCMEYFPARNCLDLPTHYSLDDLTDICMTLGRLLTHPYVEVEGQNFTYDIQYLVTYLGIPPSRYTFDTMVGHHLLHPAMPKGLDVLSSLYLPSHVYWKSEGKLFEYEKHPLERLLSYNAKDCCTTWAVAEELRKTIAQKGKELLMAEKMRYAHNAIYAMLEGVPFDEKKAADFLLDLMDGIAHYEAWFQGVLPAELVPQVKSTKAAPWYRSTQQQAMLFYDTLQLPKIFDRKTGSVTVDDNALRKLRDADPLVRPICDNLSRYRSLNIAANICKTPQDPDGKMRCSYNTEATVTHRFGSNENAFGGGTNLQNISSGEEAEIHDEIKAARKQGITLSREEAVLQLYGMYPAPAIFPNLRELFPAPEGFWLCDMDLARADAQAVAGHAGDRELLDRFDDPQWDMHESNAMDICRALGWTYSRTKHRPMAKASVHAMNYGVMARTLAKTLGCGEREAQEIIDAWFSAHPRIKDWQDATMASLQTTQSVTNVWGYSVTFYNRVSIKMLQEALAWLGQSTVAILINKIWERFSLSPFAPEEVRLGYTGAEHNLPYVSVRLQVHDSLVFMVPAWAFHYEREKMYQSARVPIPFACKPAHVIDVGLKASQESWGKVKDVSWR